MRVRAYTYSYMTQPRLQKICSYKKHRPMPQHQIATSPFSRVKGRVWPDEACIRKVRPRPCILEILQSKVKEQLTTRLCLQKGKVPVASKQVARNLSTAAACLYSPNQPTGSLKPIFAMCSCGCGADGHQDKPKSKGGMNGTARPSYCVLIVFALL